MILDFPDVSMELTDREKIAAWVQSVCATLEAATEAISALDKTIKDLDRRLHKIETKGIDE